MKRAGRGHVGNLVSSLIATLALVFVIVLMVPRAEAPAAVNVDFLSLAHQAQETTTVPLAVPHVPSDWRSNVAELRTNTDSDTRTWFIGFIPPSGDFIALSQSIDAKPPTIIEESDSEPTGTTTIAGVEWVTYNNHNRPGDHGNVHYALATQTKQSSFVLYGTASESDFETLAIELQPTIAHQENNSQ